MSLDELLYGTSALPPLVPHQMDANAVMRMAFTSGTTGNPKGVTHSFNTTLSTCRILNCAMEVTETDVFLIYLPLGLNWGYLTLLQAVPVGARAVLLDRFSAGAGARADRTGTRHVYPERPCLAHRHAQPPLISNVSI